MMSNGLPYIFTILLVLSLITRLVYSVHVEERQHETVERGMPSATSMMKGATSMMKMGAGLSRGLSATVTDKEACIGCRFVWAKTNAILDESAGYEAVKDAFERTCAHMPEVFYDSCDKMFENEDRLIQEYLNGKYIEINCSNLSAGE